MFLASPVLALALLFPLQASPQSPAPPRPQSKPAPAQAAPPSSESTNPEAHKKCVEAARLIASGDLKRALDLAKEAVAADPNSAETHYTLGLAYEAGGDLAQAESEYKKMGVYAPEALLEISLARIYLRQGKLVEAEQQARRAVEKNRWVPQPHLALGTVAMRKRDYAAAIDSFSKAVDADPRDWNARLSLADAYRAARRWDEALTQYSQALAMSPNHPQALLGRAETWEEMGRPAEAIAAYEKMLEATPHEIIAQYKLARLYLVIADPALQKPQRAVELASAAAEATSWKNAEILETLAEAYTRSGNTVKAAEVRDKIKQLR